MIDLHAKKSAQYLQAVGEKVWKTVQSLKFTKSQARNFLKINGV